METLFELIELSRWVIYTAVVGVPFFVSIYILLTPTQKLLMQWENYRMSRTGKSFRGRQTKHKRKIRIMKAICAVLIVLCGLAFLHLLQTVRGGALMK